MLKFFYIANNVSFKCWSSMSVPHSHVSKSKEKKVNKIKIINEFGLTIEEIAFWNGCKAISYDPDPDPQ